MQELGPASADRRGARLQGRRCRSSGHHSQAHHSSQHCPGHTSTFVKTLKNLFSLISKQWIYKSLPCVSWLIWIMNTSSSHDNFRSFLKSLCYPNLLLCNINSMLYIPSVEPDDMMFGSALYLSHVLSRFSFHYFLGNILLTCWFVLWYSTEGWQLWRVEEWGRQGQGWIQCGGLQYWLQGWMLCPQPQCLAPYPHSCPCYTDRGRGLERSRDMEAGEKVSIVSL